MAAETTTLREFLGSLDSLGKGEGRAYERGAFRKAAMEQVQALKALARELKKLGPCEAEILGDAEFAAKITETARGLGRALLADPEPPAGGTA